MTSDTHTQQIKTLESVRKAIDLKQAQEVLRVNQARQKVRELRLKHKYNIKETV